MIVDFYDFAVRGEKFLRLRVELNLVDRQAVVVLDFVDRDRVAHVVQQHFAFLGPNRNLHALAGLKTQRCNFLALTLLRKHQVAGFAFGLSVPELDSSVNSARGSQLEPVRVPYTVDFLGVGFNWSLEATHSQVKSVDFVARANSHQVGSVWVVADVATELGNADFEVTAVLGVELDVSVSAEQSQLRVVIAQGLNLKDLRINASLNLHR